ncbi:MAG: GGDEF domain-containing protein [Firmicutes bacterium]|nr:GGDEF domain-containing protein [Bacillota bacterium]
MKAKEGYCVDPYEIQGGIDKQLGEWGRDILETIDLGLWILLIDRKAEQYEMFMSRQMRASLGLKEAISPQECFKCWYEAINEGYYHYVNLGLENMIRSGRLTQLEYTWTHPDEGDIMVRCLGIRTENGDGKICLKGDHRIISNMHKPRFLPVGSESEIFEYNRKKQSIYFHTGRESLYGDANKENNFPECWMEQEMVHPHYVEDFCSMFQDIEDKKEVNGEEMLLKSKQGTYEWFRLKTRYLRKEKHKIHTVLVLLEPANRQRALELEYMRRESFYKAILSDTVAYAELDVESRQLKSAGGIWKSDLEKCIERGAVFDQIMDFHKDRVLAEDYEVYREQCTLDAIQSMYHEGIAAKKFSLRYLIDGEMRWVELIIHVFQEQVLENMYALILLRDIDSEKKRELAQAVAASRDPLTNLYNRKFFAYHVTRYMQSVDVTQNLDIKPPHGALLMLDLDDFKSVNDKYGHLKGDAVLKRLARVLESTFRKRDVIGRLGGDEFVVFLKGINSKRLIGRRIEHLLETLRDSTYEPDGLPFSCSIGITFVDGRHFSYEESLKQADAALYESKRKGKATYSYYEE